MIFIGIDPGFEGGIGTVENGDDPRPTVYEFPTMVVEGTTKDHREYDLDALRAGLAKIRTEHEQCFVAIEFVRGIPRKPGAVPKCPACGREKGQGASSIWLQGHGVGVIEGIVAGLGMSRQRVSPQKWRHAMSVPGGGREGKEASRLMARQMFPFVQGLDRKKDHGRAEALLIAEWLRRVRHGKG